MKCNFVLKNEQNLSVSQNEKLRDINKVKYLLK